MDEGVAKMSVTERIFIITIVMRIISTMNPN